MAKRQSKKDLERLQALIEEATMDSNGEEEAFSGLANMVQEEVACPFPARVIGEDVIVTGFEEKSGYSLNAVCERKGKKYPVDVASLEWMKPRPEGFEWIEAYLAWREMLM